jgi:putative peptide zinc metalloprotease protein
VTEAVSSPAAGLTSGAGDAGAPARADGVTLIGEMQGSGYRVAPALARRADGQTVQLTPLLYATLSALDGQRSYADIASAVSTATGRTVSEDNAVALVDKLRPMGLALQADGSQPELRRSNPLLGLRFKVAVTDEEKTRRLTAPFAALFHLAILVPVLAAFAWICWWVLFDKGLASATHEAFARPGLLLAVLAITILSAGFHEFGHAAAARRGGASPGVMGAGLYLDWPAFYTAVTDSYRLGRVGRLRTDLGGLYFNAIIAVATVGVWWVSDYDALLLLVATQILQMLRQLLPFVRFDGYHVLADLTGVPDLFQRIGPTLKSLVPWRTTDPAARALKPWARAVVTVWVLTVVPLLLATTVLMVMALPRVVGTAWASARAQQDQMAAAFGDGDVVSGLARALSMVVVLMPIAAFAYVLVRLVRQVGTGTWRRTEGRPLQRAVAALTAAAVVAALVWSWWPSEERYRPIQSYESGTVSHAVSLAAPRAGLAVGSRGAGTVMWPEGTELPTRDHPQLAAVLVPTGSTAAAADTSTESGEVGTGEAPDTGATGTGGSGDVPGGVTAPAPTEGAVPVDPTDTWIFPFDEPPAPDEGDTQALAVNTTDNTATYSVAFALVWADGAGAVDNTNEAYALASCDSCAAIAVAFQVVLVVDDAAAVAPQNISVAVNYDCTSCLTYSLAVQLFVTLDGALSEDATAAIEALWQQIMTYGEGIGQVPLSEIQSQLTGFEEQILGIIEAEQGPLTPEQSPSPSPTDATVSPTPSPTEPGATTSESPTDPVSPTSPATPTPTPTPTESATPAPTPSPSTDPSPPTTPAPVTPSPTPTSGTVATTPASSPTAAP